jgi:D-alanyl-D-alanine carboxypeptidase (penicillin-binding protein 5/6)
MNDKARDLGLTQTVFQNATGLDQAGHRSTARDLAQLARRLLQDFPEQYRRFATREFTFNELKQYNRNALLWRDATVDGIKTGHTPDAGFCLIASATRQHMRLIATVLGASDEAGRVDASQRLLEFGFRYFETRLLYAAYTPTTKVRVWMGEASQLPLGVAQPLYVTLPRGRYERLQSHFRVNEMLTAPIQAGQRLGTLVLDLDEAPLAEFPLVALRTVDTGNILQRTLDRLQLWVQ